MQVVLLIFTRSSALKKRVLIKQGGLDLLIDCLMVERLRPLAVFSLHTLTTHTVVTQPTPHHPPTHTPTTAVMPRDITFLLDDGTKVRACRDVMIGHSTVFAAMLAGHYSESDQSEIKITNASYNAFMSLVDYMHMKKYSGSKLEGQSEARCFDVLLEISALADKYSISDLLLVVSNDILTNHLSVERVAKIFLFAIMHNNEYLYKRCLFYMLTSVMSQRDRVTTCFLPCLQGDVDEIKKTVKQYLQKALDEC